MQKIPWVFVHGAVVWQIGIPVLTLATGALLRWAWRRLYARGVRREVARLSAEVRGLEVARRTHLRGTLRGGNLTTAKGVASETSSVAEPWLECSGEEVRFSAGSANIDHGSRFRTQWWHPIWPRTDRSVEVGDEVIIGGELLHDGRGWMLRGIPRFSSAVPVLDVHAIRADTRPGASGLLCAAAILGLIAAGFYGIVVHVGEAACERAWKHSNRATMSLADLRDLEIAAVTPISRDHLFDVLDSELEHDFPHSEDTFQMRVAVDELRGRCPSARYFQAMRLDEAVTAAERCGDRNDKLWGYWFDGRFADAAGHLNAYDQAAAWSIQIALGRWDEAAHSIDKFADQHHEGPETYDRCTAALFRSYGGDRHAFDRIAKLDGSCAVLKALSLPPDEQAEAIQRAADNGTLDADDERLRDLVMATLPAALTESSYQRFSCCNWFGSWRRELWFMPFIAQAHAHEQGLVRDVVEQELASLDLLRGDFTAAQRDADLIADADLQMRAQYQIDFASGRLVTPEAHDAFPELTAIRDRGQAGGAYGLEAIGDDCRADLLAAISSAAGGHGELLAHVMSECRPYLSERSSWAALLPRVKVQRAELAAEIRLYRGEGSNLSNAGAFPFRLIDELVIDRTMSHLIGDDEEAQRLQAIIDRHAKLLEDPHKLIAFMLMTTY